MNYWELMANANDSAVKKLGLEKGLIEKEKVEESAQEQSSQPEQNKVQPEEKSDFQEPTSLIVSDCGEVESLDGFDDIYKLSAREIQQKYDELGIEYKRGIAKSDLVLEYFKYALSQKKLVKVSGVLDVFQDNLGGAITFECDNYRLKKCSVYVPQLFIDKYALKRGHTVSAFAMPPREYGRENCPFAVAITSVMNGSADDAKNITPFTDLVPYYPTRRIILESPSASRTDSLPMRAVDLLTPIGFGQRALIVAPPRTGKTVLMQGMAKSIRTNAPDAHLMILLVDERPEEVTDFKRNVDAEVIASTFDEEAGNHVHAAEMVISRARRMVEAGKDVIILLDSITRLARAYNALMPNGGRTMSGGVEANALQKPKKFFGSARNIEDGGSLTIIGTALIETGSKMDEVIFEEFKGTGNLELHLDRALSDKRIFPAINIEKSGTRKEELLYHPDEMAKIYALRRAMKGVPTTDAMEMLVQRLKKTRSNIEFLLAMNY
ncbi:MAG: transcription termination factor Rho [Opitutales bacterium]|nr:transcription termination factor Rho [Opitutales bacterium]MBQ2721983.1 transcription termination factor Rho [Opitutales bacterium]